MWRLSQFTVVRPLAERGLPDHHLVFNTETGRCLVARRSDWDAILAHLAHPAAAPAPVRSAIASLAAGGLVAPAGEDTEARFTAKFDGWRWAPARIYPLLAVTSACNIACTYCYEAGITYTTMTDDVVAGCLRWMERRIVHDGIRAIHPGLFGGEPLLRPKLLVSIMDGFADLQQRYGIEGDFYCSSNGLLLTPDLAATLAAKGLRQLQISLDGPEEVHDQRRVGHRGQATFQRSLEAIRIAVDHVEIVTVKLNFDRHNRASAGALFDRLVAEGLHDRVEVKLEAIAYQFAGSRTAHDPGYPIPPESPELADAYVELSLEARARGIRVSDDTAHTTPCMFSSHHGVLIGPEGEIYKCISLVGRPEFAVGSVFDDDYDRDAYARQMDGTKRLRDCWDEACPYIPVCAGGCAYEAITRTGRFDERFCTKDQLAEYHFQRHLVRHAAKLEALGMRPLAPAELAARAPSPGTGPPPPTLIPVSSVGVKGRHRPAPAGRA